MSLVREVAWICRDKVALLLVVGIPLIAFAILAATFSNAVIRDLRVDVVDQDRSKTSETFVQAISSAPGVTVARRSSDLNGAMHAVRSGEAIAAVYIPQNLERDIAAGRRPQVVIFFNKQFFTPGNVASSSLQAALSAAVADLPAGPRSAAFTPGPLVVEQYVLTNPALNYAQFLLRAILPTVLHIVIAISAGYAVGSEFGSRNMREWLATAGDSMLIALVGKLAPYFGIFLVMMAVGLGIIHGIFEIPFRGDPVLVGAAACLLIIAYLSLGALLQLLVRNLAFGLSLTGIICSPAFGFAGVGFPVLGHEHLLPCLGRDAAAALVHPDPVRPGGPRRTGRGFRRAFHDAGRIGGPLFRPGLAEAARHRSPSAAETGRSTPSMTGRAGSALFAHSPTNMRGVIRDRMAFGLIVLAPIIYGVFYPQPYLGQLIKDIPIAVVDDDSSDVSRTIIQAVNADEAVKVALRPTTLAEAQAALARREVFGILSIPAGTEREILKGDQARLPAYVDSAYFLLYNRTLQGIQEGVGAVTADLAARSARPDGSLYRAALAKSSPVEILNQPLFNPTGGYGSYVVPAAFLLILQQTRLMGAATLAGVAYEQGGRGARRRRGTVSAVIGQSLAHLLLALPGFALFLIVLPRVYGFSASDHVLDLIVLAIPFILSVSLLGQFVGSWFKRRETAVLLFVAISLPIFFLVGVAWPLEAIPPMLRTASFILPSTFGIDGLVRVNQMGATLTDVSKDWMGLWVLTGVYAILAVASARITAGWRVSDAR